MKSANNDIVSFIGTQATENVNYEHKAAFGWTCAKGRMEWIQAQCIKTILGFSNTVGGGVLLIGVNDDSKGSCEFTGLTDEQLETFENWEAIKANIAKFADSPISFSIDKISYVRADKTMQFYVAFRVDEFNKLPVLCRCRHCHDNDSGETGVILEANDLYSRSLKGRIGTQKAGRDELASIIEMAHAKDEDRILRLVSNVCRNNTTDSQEPSQYEKLDTDL